MHTSLAELFDELQDNAVSLADCVACGRKILHAEQRMLTYNEPDLEAKILAGHAFGVSPTELLTEYDRAVKLSQKQRYISCLRQRIEGQPIGYITGEQAFWTLSLETSRETLIPRADTETLVESALALELPANANVLDLGTGTGAIALALKSERPHWKVTGSDFKQTIVELARRNAKRNELEVEFLKSDWFSAINMLCDANSAKSAFDLIVSNPPYVESQSAYLQQGDLLHEPSSALVSGVDGLEDIRHIIGKAHNYLNSNGYLLIEHGFEQSADIQALLASAGYTSIESKKDLNGLDRVTLGQLV
ncbi:peptide chain release factor N(5)-glutamine methyltransferase [Glaciecola sp. MH2013]|uniref:peptide chain release factor N(5)-glutamine methyltransferase n=1 Tax=Glaciecola sp. MH2013 TaxID=2785524 RepID=UPI00189D0FA2|nr:peptide chain release factor N(5)-glutamine methyltransferase [Glaciecola sp. MH2013]MBF7072564.1 peptide chain release factor N(5)-glutamine methyltransferase [Glaciecola sp. MH2013]